MDTNEVIRIFRFFKMDVAEVIDFLDTSKQRLSDMKRAGKIIKIKKGIFLREEVEQIKLNQNDLRNRYNKEVAYDLFPIYKKLENTTIINKLRFLMC